MSAANDDERVVAAAPVEVPVPRDERMAKEPALAIGTLFASKSMVKTYIAATFTALSLVVKVTPTPEQLDALALVLTGLGIVATTAIAQWEAMQRARAQAAETRKHVYAPATVYEVAAEAADAGAVAAVPVSVPRPA